MCIEIADVNHSVSGIGNHFNVFLLRLKGKTKITPKENQLMSEKENPKVRFYRLPKMCTTAVPLRPIVASNTHSYDLAVDDRNPLTVYRKSISND